MCVLGYMGATGRETDTRRTASMSPGPDPLAKDWGRSLQKGRELEAENMMEIPSGTSPLGVAKPDHSPRSVRSCRGLYRRAITPRAVLCLSAAVSPAAVPIK